MIYNNKNILYTV